MRIKIKIRRSILKKNINTAFFIPSMALLLVLNSGCVDKEEMARLQKALDIAEIQNLMSLHAWYHAVSMNDVELEKIWSKRDDIVWGQNSGYWVGRDAIVEYYGRHVERKDTKGMFVWHTITTPVIEVAGDRKTAKGVWYTPGVVGGFDINSFNWMFERYGVDFVFEDGAWKVWHMVVYTDAAWPLNGTISADGMAFGPPPPASDEGTGGETIGAEAAKAPAPGGKPTVQKVIYKGVSPTTEQVLVPRPPEPYETWEDTWSYVEE
jgi:hypothetical protein